MRALGSVLAQSFPDWEAIVIDDGSVPPITVAQDARVRLLRHVTARGPGAARNTGLDAARGACVAFCDSDDAFDPERLEQARLAHAAADLVVCGQGSLGRRRGTAGRQRGLARLLEGYTPSLGATSIRRSGCPRFDERFLACQDVEWWIRVVQADPSCRVVALVHYLVGRSDHRRVLNSAAARLDYSYFLLERHADFFRANPRSAAFRWLRICQMERKEGNAGLALRALWSSLGAYPTAGACRETARLALAAFAGSAPPERIETQPLPPLSCLRARRLASLRRGTRESRLHLDSWWLRSVSALSAGLPRLARGAARRLGTKLAGDRAVLARCAWGEIMFEPGETRLLSPYEDEAFESALVARMLQGGEVFIDVGANRGWYTLLAARRVGKGGRVVAVEPDRRMVRRLRRLAAVNGIEERVRILPVALGAATGTARFVLAAEPSLSHLLSPGAGAGGAGAANPIEAVDFPGLVALAGLAAVDFLKLDIEGQEPEVLRGVARWIAAGAGPPAILFEYEAAHYGRYGLRFSDAWGALQDRYRLFLVDSRAGRLVPHDSADAPRFQGRNVLALPRERAAGMLLRVQGFPA